MLITSATPGLSEWVPSGVISASPDSHRRRLQVALCWRPARQVMAV